MEQTIGFGDKASNERIGDGAATELIWAGEEREAALGRMGLGHWAGGAPVDGFGWAGARAARDWRRACGWIWLGGSSSRKGLGVAACSGGKGSEKDAPAVRSSGDFGVRRRRARAGFQQQVGFGGSRRRARGGRQRLGAEARRGAFGDRGRAELRRERRVERWRSQGRRTAVSLLFALWAGLKCRGTKNFFGL